MKRSPEATATSRLDGWTRVIEEDEEAKRSRNNCAGIIRRGNGASLGWLVGQLLGMVLDQISNAELSGSPFLRNAPDVFFIYSYPQWSSEWTVGQRYFVIAEEVSAICVKCVLHFTHHWLKMRWGNGMANLFCTFIARMTNWSVSRLSSGDSFVGH